jgi:hypothetical protein
MAVDNLDYASILAKFLCEPVNRKFLEIMDEKLVKFMVTFFESHEPKQGMLDEFKQGFKNLNQTNTSYVTAILACLFQYDTKQTDKPSDLKCVSLEQMKTIFKKISEEIDHIQFTEPAFNDVFKHKQDGFTSKETVYYVKKAIGEPQTGTPGCTKLDLIKILEKLQQLLSHYNLIDDAVHGDVTKNGNGKQMKKYAIESVAKLHGAIKNEVAMLKNNTDHNEKDKLKNALELIVRRIRRDDTFTFGGKDDPINITLGLIEQLHQADRDKLPQFVSFMDSQLHGHKRFDSLGDAMPMHKNISTGIRNYMREDEVNNENAKVLDNHFDTRLFAYRRKVGTHVLPYTTNGNQKSWHYHPY